MTERRKRIPRGISTYREIVNEGYIYVDKTDIVWQLANDSKFNYLSRPRRFGKSLLVDTLACYLEGRVEMFEGRKIMDLEKDWTQHPVLRLDMSRAGGTEQNLKAYLNRAFQRYEKKYGVERLENDDYSVRFSDIIHAAYEQDDVSVAVLIDEYDHPLQHSWGTPEHEKLTAIYRSVFSILKADSAYLRLVFITGVTKFTQISLFSCLNNLTNISFLPQYATICGFTLDEIKDNFGPEIDKMGEFNCWTHEQTIDKLVENYDGYHFSRHNMVGLFNPFSLTNALADSDIGVYWIGSGATIGLRKFVKNLELRLPAYEYCGLPRSIMEGSDVNLQNPQLFLYQSGYLTIESADEGGYKLCIPNMEVRTALYQAVIPSLTSQDEGDAMNTQMWLREHLVHGEADEAVKALGALVADVPYSNKKLASMDMEERYRLIIYSIVKGLGLPAQVERMAAKGRADIVLKANEYIWAIELKLTKNGGLDAALAQIADRQYKAPFEDGHQRTIGLAIELDDEGRGIVRHKAV